MMSNPLSPPSPTPEMVEKCARAIYKRLKKDDPNAYIGDFALGLHNADRVTIGGRFKLETLALAAMEALMEPTIDMQNYAHAGEDEVGAYKMMLTRAMGR